MANLSMANFSVHAILILSLIVAGILVYVPFLLVAYGRLLVGMEALATPRALVDKLPPYAQRATWAHQNAFEAFTLFAVAALMAYVTNLDGRWVAGVAIAHLLARLFYPVFYVANIPIGRSLMFAIGSAGTATLMVASLLKVLSAAS